MPLFRVGALFVVAFLATLLPAFVAHTQVVINEIMQNPEFAGDTEGEWFEVYNIGDSEVDLDGWTIRDNGSNSHVIEPVEPLVIPPGGYVVLGRNADSLLNGNVPVSYAYGSDITFSNGADQVILEDADGVERDRVEYDDGLTFPDPTGASMELVHPLSNNLIGEFWKEAVTAWAGNDKGTPGSANSVLDEVPPTVLSVLASEPSRVEVVFSEPVDPGTSQMTDNYLILPDIGVPIDAEQDSLNRSLLHLMVDPLLPGIPYTLSVQGVTDLVGNMVIPGVYPFSLGSPLTEGDIVVTEIMKDPSAVGDADGEWFEVYNVTSSAIDMGGWSISDGGSNAFTIQAALVIPSRSFGVFCVNADSSVNGGMFSPVMYDWGTSGTFTLGNTADKIIITSGGLLIDSVSYDDGPSWPDLTGASMGLMDFSTDNNTGGHWTAATTRQPHYDGGGGDLGSPGTLGDNQSTGSGPQILLDPDSIDIIVGSNEVLKQPLEVINAGTEMLTWSVSSSTRTSTCPWLTITPDSGEVSPGERDTIRTRVTPAGLPGGAYSCTIVVETNDQLSPVIIIPVFLRVVDTTVSGSVSIPDDLLPIPVEGDTVEMDVTVINNTHIGKQTDVWVTMLRPGEPEPREVVDAKPLALSPLESIDRTRNLYIPPHAPAGVYALTLQIGRSPDSVAYSSTFLFEKDGASDFGRIGLNGRGIPVRSFLDQSYPSPFNASTTILYGVSEDTWVTVRVYDLLGREVATLVNQLEFAGYKSVTWDGRNNDGRVTSSGTYVYQIRAGDFSETRTMVFLK